MKVVQGTFIDGLNVCREIMKAGDYGGFRDDEGLVSMVGSTGIMSRNQKRKRDGQGVAFCVTDRPSCFSG